MAALLATEQDLTREALLASFREWGLDEKRTDHKKFIDRCVSKTKENLNGRMDSSDEVEISYAEDFPKAFIDAIKYVFLAEYTSELDEDILFDVVDHLTVQVPSLDRNKVTEMPPYRKARHRYNTRSGGYEIKPEFQRFQKSELDPFVRFSYEHFPSREEYHRDNLSNAGSLFGIAFEGIVACHASKQIACLNCFGRSLVWNGGYEGAWSDLVCKKCQSTYELKTKQSMEAIEKIFSYESTWGGSFPAFQKMRKSFRGGKHYIVFVCRTPSFVKSGKAWSVVSAEIDQVTPRLDSSAFFGHHGSSYLPIKSMVTVKKGTRKRWFDIPHFEFDVVDIAKETFREIYGEENDGAWDEVVSEEHRATRESETTPKEKTVEELR
jgi:hypothetical protein